LDNLFYETFVSISEPQLTTQVYNKVEPKGSNQQNPIGFMFGERPTYKAVRQSIKTKNATTNQDTYVDSVNFEATENYAFEAEEQLTPEQNKNIEDLKTVVPAYANYTNEQIQAFIDSKSLSENDLNTIVQEMEQNKEIEKDCSGKSGFTKGGIWSIKN